MTRLETLEAARALLARGWTQNVCARNEKGEGVGSRAPEAVCWCALGAINAVTSSSFEGAAVRAAVYQAILDSVRSRHPFLDLSGWNDRPNRTQEEVLELFDAAIARLKSECPAPTAS